MLRKIFYSILILIILLIVGFYSFQTREGQRFYRKGDLEDSLHFREKLAAASCTTDASIQLSKNIIACGRIFPDLYDDVASQFYTIVNNKQPVKLSKNNFSIYNYQMYSTETGWLVFVIAFGNSKEILDTMSGYYNPSGKIKILKKPFTPCLQSYRISSINSANNKMILKIIGSEACAEEQQVKEWEREFILEE